LEWNQSPHRVATLHLLRTKAGQFNPIMPIAPAGRLLSPK
jgi:hypothetical protein